MFLSTLQLLLAIAGTSTLVWAVFDRRVTMMAATSAGVWSIIALGGASVSVHTETGGTVTHETAVLQYVAGFFALVSFFAVYSFWKDWIPHPQHHRRATDSEDT